MQYMFTLRPGNPFHSCVYVLFEYGHSSAYVWSHIPYGKAKVRLAVQKCMLPTLALGNGVNRISSQARNERKMCNITLTTQLIAAADVPAPRLMPTDVSRALVVKSDKAPPKKYCTPRQPIYSLY